MTCDFCGKTDLLPYTCSYCEKTFCAQHRLPENHECASIGAGKRNVKKKSPESVKKKISTVTYDEL